MMKYALFLVCALVAIQGLQARSVDPEDRSISDIVNKIKEVVDKIADAIIELSAQIPWIINHVKDKVTEILIKIPNLIIDIEDKTSAIIKEHGVVGQKCVDAQKTKLRGLVLAITVGFQGCVGKAGKNFDDLKLKIAVLINRANSLKEDISLKFYMCGVNNSCNPEGLKNCLIGLVGEVKEDIATLGQETKDIIAEGQEAAQAARIALTDCVAKVETETIAKENAVLDEINACVNA